MSNKPHVCARCRVEGVCASVVPFEPERENAFAVSWKCPRCEEQSLVISPLGPWLAPTPGMCLQCGQEGLVAGQTCPGCGLRITEVLSPDETGRTDEELLQVARSEFARGTCRRGLTLVNHVLQRNPKSGEAWSIKGQFFEYLGFRRALKAAMQEAVRLQGSEGSGPSQARPGPGEPRPAAEPEAVRLKGPEGAGPSPRGARWWQFWK